MKAPPGFEYRAVTIDAGGDRIYHRLEWRDALILVTRGEIELECRDGSSQRLARGDVFWLAGLPLRRIHNCGSEPARLLAVRRCAG